MKNKMIVVFLMLFFIARPARGMQEIAHITGSAFVTAGSFFFAEGLYRQHIVVMELIRRQNIHFPIPPLRYAPIFFDTWIKEIGIPVLGGAALACVGMLLI